MNERNAAIGLPIETKRLRLRPYRLADRARRGAMVGNPHVMRFFSDAVQDAEDNWERLLRYAGHWSLLGYGLFAVEERRTGRYAGEVGLARFERGLGADFDSVPEAAWMLDEWAEGRGYATEAITAAIDWHQTRFGTTRLGCIIVPDNAASLRVAAKLGFVPMREERYHDRRVLVFERPPLPIAADPR